MTEAPTAPASSPTSSPSASPDGYPGSRASDCPFDPPPATTKRLQEQPISRVELWNGAAVWLVTRHADQVALLRDPRISADNTRPSYPSISAAQEAARAHNRTFITQDEPEHNEQRRHFTGDFTVKRLNALRPRVSGLVDQLLDDMEAAGPPADLVSSFALPLPSLVICELLGVPYSDHDFFQKHSAVLINTTSTGEQALAASTALIDYLGALIERKAEAPQDDLLSRMATEYLLTGVNTRDELAKQARLLLVAGHETTANMIALGTCALLQHPEQLAAVRDGGPGRVAGAVEELLRYLTIVHSGRRRVAVEDIEIGGEVIRAGEGVICAMETANRDPEIFEDPDRLDVDRETSRRHIAFGSGPHQCLGQNLARLELQLAYPALFRRFPRLRLDRPLEEIPFRKEMIVYGVHELPVAW
jgi:cytochrome P450